MINAWTDLLEYNTCNEVQQTNRSVNKECDLVFFTRRDLLLVQEEHPLLFPEVDLLLAEEDLLLLQEEDLLM